MQEVDSGYERERELTARTARADLRVRLGGSFPHLPHAVLRPQVSHLTSSYVSSADGRGVLRRVGREDTLSSRVTLARSLTCLPPRLESTDTPRFT